MPFGISKDPYDIVYFITGSAISNRLGVAAPPYYGLKSHGLTALKAVGGKG